MTQPHSVNMTFDTSLVDLNQNTSFSTTESDPSELGSANAATNTKVTPTLQQTCLSPDLSQGTPKQSQTATLSTMAASSKPSTPVQHVPTQEAYDQWASIYDSDGNMLQSIDDFELATLLPDLLSTISNSSKMSPIALLDLGCGTGRNTAKLLAHPWSKNRQVQVAGLDFSKGMLDVAAQKLNLQVIKAENKNLSLRLECCDCFPTVNDASASPLPVSNLLPVNAVISTLVLEHIPLTPYFATLSSLLAPGGYALITNMHSEMGNISQAGFINAEGVKVRGSSFAHTVEEAIAAARDVGLEILSVKERAMTKEDVESGVAGERGKKWIGIQVWYGLVLRKGL